MPLSKGQLAEMKTLISNAEASLKDAMADIATAKRAGVDMKEAEDQARELREKIRKMKVVYG